MTAIEFLSQAYWLDQQIRSKQDQLARLKSLATSCGQPNGREHVSCSPESYAMENSVMKILEAEQELKEQVDALVRTMMEIREVIGRVKDIRLRLVLEKRHLLFQTWKEIADDLGRSIRWVQERHRMALEVVEGMMGE